MKLAILGTRGVPPSYGGFETFAAELGTRLAARGHEVSVYCRETQSRLPAMSGERVRVRGRVSSEGDAPHPNPLPTAMRLRRGEGTENSWNGIRRLVVPALHGSKYLETVSHSFLSAFDAMRRDFDAVLVCNAANAFVLPLLKAARIPVAINVDGIERKRRKWNVLGRAVYAIGEAFSAAFANAVIADAAVIARYYRDNYAIEPTMIPYGADFPADEDSDVLARLGLEPRNYILYVSRFEPENNPLEVVQAYEKQFAVRGSQFAGESDLAPANREPRTANLAIRGSQFAGESDLAPANREPRTANTPLVMLGKGLYAPDLVAALERHASERVLFPGALYGADYRTLQRNALLYIQATEVGGTHPAMIEAMASGGAVLAHDTPENREVGGDAVGYFRLRPDENLSGTIREWLSNSLQREDFRARARKRAEERYSWERVTDQYEGVLRSL